MAWHYNGTIQTGKNEQALPNHVVFIQVSNKTIGKTGFDCEMAFSFQIHNYINYCKK